MKSNYGIDSSERIPEGFTPQSASCDGQASLPASAATNRRYSFLVVGSYRPRTLRSKAHRTVSRYHVQTTYSKKSPISSRKSYPLRLSFEGKEGWTARGVRLAIGDTSAGTVCPRWQSPPRAQSLPCPSSEHAKCPSRAKRTFTALRTQCSGHRYRLLRQSQPPARRWPMPRRRTHLKVPFRTGSIHPSELEGVVFEPVRRLGAVNLCCNTPPPDGL